MFDFSAPLDDILHSLHTVAGADTLPGYDRVLATEILTQFARFADDVLAPLDAIGDAEGCLLDNGQVKMPAGFREAYQQLAEDGWQGFTAPEAFGGMGLSPALYAGVSEIFSGANHSLQMVTSLVPGAITTLLHHGTEAQQARYVPLLASGEWLSTMALTEAGAGSDLGSIRTRAERISAHSGSGGGKGDGEHYHLTGEKIFISGGDQDLCDGILHLVLARTGDQASGVKGLSLFACPARLANGPNGIKTLRIEKKLGLHASPTCLLAFDGAEAELIGEEGRGLTAMFTMMNHARLDVALQGVAHAARGASLARRYASERIQGRDAQGNPVTIEQHADVARMLDEAERLARGSRVLCHQTLVALERDDNPTLVNFLTPVCKVFCSEAGIRAADIAIQVMGGYGYLSEYRAEQNWRDARICAIYEGANGIHARALATRSLRVDDGRGTKAFAAFITATAEHVGDQALASAARDWKAQADTLAASDHAEENAYEFMQQTGELAWGAALAALDAVGPPA